MEAGSTGFTSGRLIPLGSSLGHTRHTHSTHTYLLCLNLFLCNTQPSLFSLLPFPLTDLHSLDFSLFLFLFLFLTCVRFSIRHDTFDDNHLHSPEAWFFAPFLAMTRFIPYYIGAQDCAERRWNIRQGGGGEWGMGWENRERVRNYGNTLARSVCFFGFSFDCCH